MAETSLSLIGSRAVLFHADCPFDLDHQQRFWAMADEAATWGDVLEAVPGMTNLTLFLSEVPLTRLPRGPLSVAGLQTGVSASAGPSGWNTIGSADVRFFDPFRNPAALLKPGEGIRFHPVDVAS